MILQIIGRKCFLYIVALRKKTQITCRKQEKLVELSRKSSIIVIKSGLSLGLLFDSPGFKHLKAPENVAGQTLRTALIVEARLLSRASKTLLLSLSDPCDPQPFHRACQCDF